MRVLKIVFIPEWKIKNENSPRKIIYKSPFYHLKIERSPRTCFQSLPPLFSSLSLSPSLLLSGFLFALMQIRILTFLIANLACFYTLLKLLYVNIYARFVNAILSWFAFISVDLFCPLADPKELKCENVNRLAKNLSDFFFSLFLPFHEDEREKEKKNRFFINKQKIIFLSKRTMSLQWRTKEISSKLLKPFFSYCRFPAPCHCRATWPKRRRCASIQTTVQSHPINVMRRRKEC